MRALTKKLKKPTDRKLLLQALRAACRLLSDCELMVSILRKAKAAGSVPPTQRGSVSDYL